MARIASRETIIKWFKPLLTPHLAPWLCFCWETPQIQRVNVGWSAPVISPLLLIPISWLARRKAKAQLGDRVFILGHHYQRDEVIQFADVTGDSFKLAQKAAAQPQADFIVFCGVHFMAESADILTSLTRSRSSFLTSPRVAPWPTWPRSLRLSSAGLTSTAAGVADVTTIPNHLHELHRRDQGVHRPQTRWLNRVHLEQCQASASSGHSQRGEKVLFLPDQHLGRNTAVQGPWS